MRANNIVKLYFAVTLSTLLIFSCTKKEDEEEAIKKVNDHQVELSLHNLSEGIEIQPVVQKPFPLTMALPGRVVIPDKDFLVLTARTSGRVDSVPLNIGDKVHPGTMLAMIWSPDLATAVDEYEMAKTQKISNLITLSEAKLKSLGISVKDAVSGRASFPLRSPLEGVVLDKKLNVGSSVNPGDQIMTIGKTGSFQFQADVPPSDALQLKPGMQVTFEDSPDLKAVIDTVSSIADPSSRLVRVRCRFGEIKNMNLAQETFLKAKVILRERDSLVTSLHALVVDESSQYLFVQDKQNPKIFNKVKVKVVSSAAGELAFESLDAALDFKGAKVVTDGALLLNGILEDAD